jgi:hypothetical protein
MELRCPKCHKRIEGESLNAAKDLAVCTACGQVFQISELSGFSDDSPAASLSPPNGTWFRSEGGRWEVGATTKSWAALFLIPFMCVWSGLSLWGIYGTQFVKGEFNLTESLFGIPFVLGIIVFWSIAVMTVCGKVTVTTDGDRGKVFVGVGNIGWRKQFVWSAIRAVREESSNLRYPGGQGVSICLEGDRRVAFGSGISPERRYFLVRTLRAHLLTR